MKFRRRVPGRRLLFLGFSGLAAVQLSAVLFLGTDDPTHNTTAPEGEFAGSGWQWEGEWMSFLGTAIGPHHFVSAKHISGVIGGEFVFRGQRYRTTAAWDDPTGDMKIWRVCGTLPDWAPLYDKTNELGRTLVVIGRGTRRGEPVYLTNGVTRELRGWRWGHPDNVRRWGTNVLTRIVTDIGNGGGDLLTATFDRDGGADEASISGGDSGGAMFIQDGDTWKFAGINSFVDGGFSYTNAPPTFNAALYDAGGFYFENDKKLWELIPDTPEDMMSEAYFTRVSTKLEWIQSVLSQPAPAEETPVLLSAANPEGPFDVAPQSILLPEGGSFSVRVSGDNQYFRIRSACPTTIVSLRVEGKLAVVHFQ